MEVLPSAIYLFFFVMTQMTVQHLEKHLRIMNTKECCLQMHSHCHIMCMCAHNVCMPTSVCSLLLSQQKFQQDISVCDFLENESKCPLCHYTINFMNIL